MIRRTSQKLSNKIPITQAAYRAGISTTENVFTFKVLAEKAITSTDYETHLLMLDMSKAFDTVQRKSLFDELQEILPEDELHMLYILINDVNLKVRCGKTTGEKINTNIGVPQGDCLSPVLFTLYLAAALETKRNREDHNYSKPRSCSTVANHIYPHLEEHSYNRTKDTILIDQQYADDIGWAANNVQNISSLEANITARIHKYNLHVNKGKTEQYCIKRNGEEHWRKCKYLGSLLSTTEDIKRRKQLANAAYSKLKYILEDRRTTLKIKIRTLDAYVGSIFLYNSELWTVTQDMEDQIDVLQINFLRRILGIKWPEKISNTELYTRTQVAKWSQVILKRRLRWYGHMQRLDDNTPARQALKEALRSVNKPQGRPKITWLKLVRNNLMDAGIQHYYSIDLVNLNDTHFHQEINELAQDRDSWRVFIENAMYY